MTAVPSIDVDLFRNAVAAAVRAPSVYNVQPWRFALVDGAIEVRIDPYRLLPVADPGQWATRIACGAAIANIELSLVVAGVRTKTRLWPRSGDDLVVATIGADGACAPSPRQQTLASAIPRRRSNRRPFSDAPVPADARARIVAAAEASGGWLTLVDDRTSVADLAAIVRDAEQLLRSDAAYVAEMQAWTSRYHTEQVGIPTGAAGIAPAPQDVLAMRDYGGKERAEGRDFEQEPLLAILGTSGGEPLRRCHCRHGAADGAPHRHRRRARGIDALAAHRDPAGPRRASSHATPAGHTANDHQVRFRSADHALAPATDRQRHRLTAVTVVQRCRTGSVTTVSVPVGRITPQPGRPTRAGRSA